MHEMALAQGTLDIVLDNAAKHGATTVTRVKLVVGQMTEVVPDSLRFCFDALAKGTPAEGAELEIEITPLLGSCRDCQNEFAIERFRFQCPACGSAGVEIISGRELRVDQLEVD